MTVRQSKVLCWSPITRVRRIRRGCAGRSNLKGLSARSRCTSARDSSRWGFIAFETLDAAESFAADV
jgi:hypothetical protein